MVLEKQEQIEFERLDKWCRRYQCSDSSTGPIKGMEHLRKTTIRPKFTELTNTFATCGGIRVSATMVCTLEASLSDRIRMFFGKKARGPVKETVQYEARDYHICYTDQPVDKDIYNWLKLLYKQKTGRVVKDTLLRPSR